ncbi:MAG: winged helix-turn-helix transcriptional regulator [Crenarchaeota archaeon]|nr:winged helix-turn-helix transcriptional regulator [Thermoproteota archaeon]
MSTLLLTVIVLINITSGGLPIVNMHITLHRPTYLINITLPTLFIDKMIYVRDGCTGTLLPYSIINNSYIQILNIVNCSTIQISYVAMPNITNMSLGVTIYARSLYNRTIITWSKNIIIIPTERELYLIRFLSQREAELENGHRYYIKYIVLLPLSRPIENIHQISKTSSKKKETNNTIIYIALIITLLAVDVILWPLLKKKRSSKERIEEIKEIEDLSEIEKKIINILRQRGGTVLQSELYRILGIPRTTLWRAVKRLEERGIVKIEKINRLNRIVLVEDLEK